MHPIRAIRDSGGRDPAALRRGGWWPRAAHGRGQAAQGRLRAAQSRFDLSVVALRKAALDHVDCQDVASLALHAVLHHLVACRARYGSE